MKKKLFKYGLALFIAVAGILFLIKFTHRFPTDVKKNDEFKEALYEPVLGVYDRSGQYSSEKILALHPYSFEWLNFKDDPTLPFLSAALSKKEDMLINIKTWYTSTMFNKYSNVLEATVKGDYDNKIKAFCLLLSRSHNLIYLRFNPEMEVPVSRFPWQSQSPDLYVQAFRHFVEVARQNAANIKFIWGPAGYPGTLEFYPGDDVVDVASVTLGSESEPLTNAYPKYPSIANEIRRKLHRLRFVDKPVFILGSVQVKKDTFNTKWIDMAINDIKSDTSVIYSAKNFVRADKANGSKRKSPLMIGVFDPKQLLVNQKEVTVEHIFSDWAGLEDGLLKKQFDEVVSRHHDVIVTLEPWKSKHQPKDTNVLLSILSGRYDQQTKELYRIISTTSQVVYLRFLHEMEIPINRYPWQSQDPVTYIKAFRYFMLFDKMQAKNVRRVWGPAGDRGSLEWWPGEDAVDYISLAIYGLPDKNITDFKQQESFKTIFDRKYYRMRFVNKPVFITEFGVKGPEDYKTNWLKDAAVTINKNAGISGISYFNYFDTPKAWGKIKPPDWGLTKETFESFCRELNEKR